MPDAEQAKTLAASELPEHRAPIMRAGFFSRQTFAGQ
jgi:hypothetical protein